MKICVYIKCKGQDVICTKHNKILGDIIGYSGNVCKICKDRKVK